MTRTTPVEVTFTVESIDHSGLGAGEMPLLNRHGEPIVEQGEVQFRPIAVRNGLPGETVTARILKKRRGVRYGDAVAVSEPAPHRQVSACRFFPRCGGCAFHHLSYPEQLALKQSWLAEALQQAGVRPASWRVPLSAGRGGYRRKARFGVRKVGEQVLVGFRESFSNRVSRMDECRTLTPELSKLLAPLQACIAQLSIAAAVPQVECAQGDAQVVLMLRHLEPLAQQDLVLLRQFEAQHECTLLLQSGGYDSLVGLPDAASPNPLSRNIPELRYTLPEYGLSMEFSPAQFTQVNAAANQILVRTVMAHLGNIRGCSVVDLFCGVGNFSLPCVRRGATVSGFEAAAESVAKAQHNAHRNGVATRAEFFTADLYQANGGVTPALSNALSQADAIVLDPPRSGCGEHLQGWLDLFPGSQIAYVSCHPESFAQDALTLQNAGFTLEQVGIVDMFPQTAHVETIGYFKRQVPSSK